MNARRAACGVWLLAVGACAPSAVVTPSIPRPPSPIDVPLIPRAVLFGSPERTSPQLSPDGTTIAWLAPTPDGVLNVWSKPASGGDARAVTHETRRPIAFYAWADGGARVVYLQDDGGDENHHLYLANVAGGAARDLTPFPGVKAQNVLTSVAHPGRVFVGLNRRDPHAFDMYRVDVDAGTLALEAQNPGDVLSWTTDADFVIRAATAFEAESATTVLRIRDGVDAPWRDLVRMPFDQALFNGQVVGGSLIAGFAHDGKSLFVHSAMGHDRGRLVRIDAQSGRELEVLAEDPEADVADDDDDINRRPAVLLHPTTNAVQAVEFEYATPRWKFLDADVATDFALVAKESPGFVRLLSRNRDDRTWIVSTSRSDAPVSYLTFDRATKKVTPLFTDNPALARYELAPKTPVVIRARDGLSLVSYLTLPPHAAKSKLPTVLLIHGGPWIRDDGNYDPEVQLLANRGYAVLQVNYRGSTGFGVPFVNASNHQWGRGTQEDLYDAVAWAIAQGIADPKRVCAMGWSGGGYATLRALSMRPDLFACGVDAVGPADLATLFRSFPPYWGGILTRWRLRVGDVEHDDALNRALSPLFHVDAIRAPLLIGQGKNDPRVTIANADAMVKALRAAHREVEYVVYPDEGHGFDRPPNNIDFHARVERFLAKHLGGRAETSGKIEGTTAEVR